ncbi:MAG: hypothetical protein KGZ68_18180 [Dechloromonas sp.]|nr:hypothetical protein [Dechloromonas sp.]
MRDILGKYIKGSQFVVFCILIPLWGLGFAYEYSYFKQLGLVSNDYLGARHYFYAGAFWIGHILLGLFVINSVQRFFSKDIHNDIAKDTVEAVQKIDFKYAVTIFRFVIIVTVVYWLLSFLEFSKDWFPGMMGLMWWLVACNLGTYSLSMLTGEKHTHATLTVMFAIGITLTMSASGFLHARHALHADAKTFRDDSVLIERDGEKFKVSAKSLSVPIPYVEKILDIVFGNNSSGH